MGRFLVTTGRTATFQWVGLVTNHVLRPIGRKWHTKTKNNACWQTSLFHTLFSCNIIVFLPYVFCFFTFWLLQRRNNCVAVIGDGAITGGMAFEAMNCAGYLGIRHVVILNDNGQVTQRMANGGKEQR